MNSSAELGYIRITKLRDLRGPPEGDQGEAVGGATSEGSPDPHLNVGYVVDGWFLETPRVGRGMAMLRFRRNGVHRLGVFTSSAVTLIREIEIQTVNSVYQIEHRSFNRGHLPAD